METRKFWCHYLGTDGNTPKRRSMELTDISGLLPGVSNKDAKTPIWFEKEERELGNSTYTEYSLYVQLSDKVAVWVQCLSANVVERANRTDNDIESEGRRWWEAFLAEHPNASDEYRAREEERNNGNMKGKKEDRDRILAYITAIQDYDSFLLTGDQWIMSAVLQGYREVNSPILPIIEGLRNMGLKRREEEDRIRREERKREEEEEARRKAEEARQEEERLTQEAGKFRNGESIAGCDVVDLCRRYGISIHLRTVHNLQQVVCVISGKDQTCQYYKQRGKRHPQLDGCYNTARELYDYLQTH